MASVKESSIQSRYDLFIDFNLSFSDHSSTCKLEPEKVRFVGLALNRTSLSIFCSYGTR